MAVVEFDPAAFRAGYPQFAQVTEGELEAAFDVAALLTDNSGGSRIPYDPPRQKARQVVIHALMCHILTLQARGGLAVGSIASATEGSVSTSFSVPAQLDDAWLGQTQCGLFAMTLLKKYMGRGPVHYVAKKCCR